MTVPCIITLWLKLVIPNTFPKAKCTSKLALFGPLQLRAVLQRTARLPGQLPSSSSASWRFDTPLPIWCMKVPLAPCPSHERELKAQVPSGAHWNSHGKFDFRLGKVQLACAPHARGLAALAAIDAQPTAALVPLARRRFS